MPLGAKKIKFTFYFTSKKKLYVNLICLVYWILNRWSLFDAFLDAKVISSKPMNNITHLVFP